MPFKNKEDQRVWRKLYRQKNKEKIKNKEKQYYHNVYKYKDSFKEYSKAHRRKLKTRYLKSIRSAKSRFLEFSLSFDDYLLETNKPCYYCNNILYTKSVAGVGLDRIDNFKGYIIGNICSCCKTCNRIKGDDLSREEAILAIKAIIIYREKMSRNNNVLENLEKYGEFIFKPKGNSMTPKIDSGDQVTVKKVIDFQFKIGDIVYAKVKGSYYLHLISSIDETRDRYQISNNHGHVNGWATKDNVFGICVKVKDKVLFSQEDLDNRRILCQAENE